jgi:FixJ family two-component response regulator
MAACVILDINLNDGSGIEQRQGLKAAGVPVPVIYMTGNEDLPFARPRWPQGALRF